MTSGRAHTSSEVLLREGREERCAAAGRKAPIAHAQEAISKVYDLHSYGDENRDALTLSEVSPGETADQIRELCSDRLSASRVRVRDFAAMWCSRALSASKTPIWPIRA